MVGKESRIGKWSGERHSTASLVAQHGQRCSSDRKSNAQSVTLRDYQNGEMHVPGCALVEFIC